MYRQICPWPRCPPPNYQLLRKRQAKGLSWNVRNDHRRFALRLNSVASQEASGEANGSLTNIHMMSASPLRLDQRRKG